ncbi:MAG TPA: hypothetical protein DIW82_13515 [Corynebacterium nuruki]|uniref:Uncharacterized protein n=1 Tax=Corynebacterium nuruki TaxID=1032851 RepID=A0A3D4T2K8_9CORY|nr:hypothetical protein [Corynebacterium nuruki]
MTGQYGSCPFPAGAAWAAGAAGAAGEAGAAASGWGAAGAASVGAEGTRPGTCPVRRGSLVGPLRVTSPLTSVTSLFLSASGARFSSTRLPSASRTPVCPGTTIPSRAASAARCWVDPASLTSRLRVSIWSDRVSLVPSASASWKDCSVVLPDRYIVTATPTATTTQISAKVLSSIRFPRPAVATRRPRTVVTWRDPGRRSALRWTRPARPARSTPSRVAPVPVRGRLVPVVVRRSVTLPVVVVAVVMGQPLCRYQSRSVSVRVGQGRSGSVVSCRGCGGPRGPGPVPPGGSGRSLHRRRSPRPG